MAKYTKEEKQKAVDLYIRYCRQATKVIKELGYPNERHTLVSWHRGYEEKGEGKDDGREEKRLFHVYSEDQVYAAVSFYIEHGKSLSKTIETLGYPQRTRTLKRWVEKLPPLASLFSDENLSNNDKIRFLWNLVRFFMFNITCSYCFVVSISLT